MRTRFDHRADRGASAVEFALILPILVALVFGIIEFGLVFNAQISLAQAAREGVRAEALETGEGVQATRDAFLGAIGAGGDDVDVSVTSCPGDRARVAASLEYDTLILGLGPFNLSSEAVMRCGG